MNTREDCRACEALLNQDGSCSNQDCWTHPCLQCGEQRCDCPPLTAAEKMALRAELERKKLSKALTQAANEKLFPTKYEPNEKQFKATMARKPKVKLSDRRARSAAQYTAIVHKYSDRGEG